MIIDPSQSKELVKKALFGEVMQEQIGKNYYLKAATRQEKSCYKKLLSGPTADKYKLWRLGSSAITYKRLGYNKSRTETKGQRNTVVQRFYEAHNVGAIWAHLTPVLISLPSTVQNLHFLSDGPVTQYRNKAMFFMLACKMQEFYPNVTAFSWNYHEAGHGKGAPDGVGATCKRTADKVIAQKTDITDLYGFADVLRENCSGIKISVIEEADIEGMNNLIKENESNLKSFKGTLMVHQVTSHIHQPNRLVMTSLSCFCSITCNHYTLGSLEYRNKSNHLDVAVSTDSEDDVPLEKLRRGEATHASTSDSNYPAVSHVSTDSEDDVPLQKLRRIKATHASTSNPHRLEVSDVYTDSEDDVPLQNLLNHLKYKI
nr:unnamed protein product [Callosobruchus analis]